jgi:hypothetical protein
MEPQLTHAREPVRHPPPVAVPAVQSRGPASPGSRSGLLSRAGDAAEQATQAARDRANGSFQLAPLAPQPAPHAPVQAKCDAACACSPCAEKTIATLVQRKEAPTGAKPGRVPALGGGLPLPPPVRRDAEAAFRVDFGMVRVQRDDPAADELGARAFTVGTHIVFAPGAWQPETVEGRKLIAHELAHVVQQAGTAAVAQGRGEAGPGHETEADRAAEAASRGERVGPLTGAGPAVQRLSLRGAWNGLKRGARAVGNAVADVAEAGWDALVDAFWAVVEGISATAARYLRNPGTLWDDIKGAVTNGAKRLVEGLFGPLSPLSAFSSLRTWFETLVEQIPVIVEGLTSFSFSGFLRAMGGLAKITGAGMDAVLQPAEALFTALDGAIGSVVRWLAKNVIELLETVGGAVWTAAKAVVDAILWIPRKIGSTLTRVWNHVAGGLGVSTGGGETGIWAWVKSKAQAIWDAAYETVFGWVATAVKLGKSVAKSPLRGVLAGFRAMRQLAAMARRVGDALQSPNAVIAARKAVKAALDAAMAVVSAVVAALGEVWAAVKVVLAPVLQLAVAVSDAVSAVLSWLGPKLAAFGEGFVKVLKWVPEKIKAGFQAVASGGESANPWLRRLTQFVAFLINLAVNPLAIPMLILGTIWKLLPASWKLTVMKWVVGLLLAILRATQLAALALMGPLAALAQQAVIGLLVNVQNRLKGGTKAEENEVVKLSDRMAGIMQGTSFSFAMGLLAGLLEGLWDGLVGPFEMIGLLIQGIGKLAEFLGGLASSKNPVLSRIGRAVAGAWSAVSGRIGGAIRGWLSESSGGSTAMKIVKLVASIGGAIANGAQQVGSAIANALFGFLNLEDFELGNKAGYVGGLVLFEVVLAVLTAGASAVLKGATTVVGKILKVIVKIHEAFNAVMGRVLEMIPGVKRGIAALTKFVSESKAFKPIIEALERMFREIEEAGVGALRRIAGNTTEHVGEAGARQTTKAVTEVAEHAPTPKLDAPSARVEAPAPKVEGPAPKVEGPAPRAEGPPPKANTEVRARRETSDGAHEVKVDSQGVPVRCSDNCTNVSLVYADELSKHPDLADRYRKITKDAAANPDQAAREMAGLEIDLRNVRNRQQLHGQPFDASKVPEGYYVHRLDPPPPWIKRRSAAEPPVLERLVVDADGNFKFLKPGETHVGPSALDSFDPTHKAKLEDARVSAAAGDTVMPTLTHPTGVHWESVVNPRALKSLRRELEQVGVTGAKANEIVAAVEQGLKGEIRVVKYTDPVRDAHAYGVPGTVQHHINPLYTGGGSQNANLLKLAPDDVAHDAIHAWMNKLEIRLPGVGTVPLQPTRLQQAVAPHLKPTATTVRGAGAEVPGAVIHTPLE